MRKMRCRLIDTFPDFQAYWKEARQKSLEEQISLWQSEYMANYHELLEKQVNNCSEMKTDWRQIAQKVFPLFSMRFRLMRVAHDNILAVYKSVCSKAFDALELDFDLIVLIYVGIGSGAGWATRYEDKPAVLLGLENISEEKWHTKDKLQGLLAHEIGHLVHMAWRSEWKMFEKEADDPLFRLYVEGFAQKCEHEILGKETWHMKRGNEWLNWCIRNKNWLAKQFLKKQERHESMAGFFGSWFKIRGKSQTGYFLGHSFMSELRRSRSLRKIALFDSPTVKATVLQWLKSVSSASLDNWDASVSRGVG